MWGWMEASGGEKPCPRWAVGGYLLPWRCPLGLRSRSSFWLWRPELLCGSHQSPQLQAIFLQK